MVVTIARADEATSPPPIAGCPARGRQPQQGGCHGAGFPRESADTPEFSEERPVSVNTGATRCGPWRPSRARAEVVAWSCYRIEIGSADRVSVGWTRGTSRRVLEFNYGRAGAPRW